MKINNPFIITALVLLLAAQAGCNKPDAKEKTGAVKLSFVEYENNVEPYRTRLIVTDAFMRFDDGEGAEDFILYDRKRDTVYSVSSEEGTVMIMTHQNIEVSPPIELKLGHKKIPDMQGAPRVNGKNPEHYQFTANGELCYDVIAVPGMLSGVIEAMQAFDRLLASDSAVTFNTIPADLHNACDMSMSTFAKGRHLTFGFPIQEWSPGGTGRSLVDYQQDYRPDPALFVVPENYRRYNIQDFREGKLQFTE